MGLGKVLTEMLEPHTTTFKTDQGTVCSNNEFSDLVYEVNKAKRAVESMEQNILFVHKHIKEYLELLEQNTKNLQDVKKYRVVSDYDVFADLEDRITIRLEIELENCSELEDEHAKLVAVVIEHGKALKTAIWDKENKEEVK